MKIWYDKLSLNLKEFKSEKFIFLSLFDKEVIEKDKDFANNNWNIEPIFTDKIEEADVLLYHDKLDSGIISFMQENKDKPIIAFYNDDNSAPISDDILKRVNVFRTSILKTTQKNKEFALPAWSADFGQAPIRSKKKWLPGRPDKVVSFCGALTDPVRRECINKLSNNKNIVTNFIIRDSFWGGDPHSPVLRKEYIDNLQACDFVLCARGAGNFSYRLYETLSVGRIPIIVDTDISLPCDDVIDWNNFIITTPQTINEDIEKWWDNIDEEKYKSLQKYSRDIYEKFLCPSGFFNYITNNWKVR